MTDPILSSYHSKPLTDELNLCPRNGFAYQKDTSNPVPYDQAYFDKYESYRGSEISEKLNAFRLDFTKDVGQLIDVGIGSGDFLLLRGNTYGFDINQTAIDLLESKGLYRDPYKPLPADIEGLTLWDSLEHLEQPSKLLDPLPYGSHVFVSLPIFDDLHKVTQSKHYRPNEHFWYFTKAGLIGYFKDLGFTLVEFREGETEAGRESIGSFHFRKTFSKPLYRCPVLNRRVRDLEGTFASKAEKLKLSRSTINRNELYFEKKERKLSILQYLLIEAKSLLKRLTK